MNIKRKYIIIGILVWIMSWVGNAYYFKMVNLKEPLFLKHYLEVKEGMSTISLYYIDLANRDDKIVSIYFPEIEYRPVILNKSSRIYSRNYELKSIELNLVQGDTKDVLDRLKNTIITKIEVEYKNGVKRVIDIGRIYLFEDTEKYDFTNLNSDILRFRAISSSTDGRTIATFKANDNLKINRLNYKFTEVDGLLRLKINGKLVDRSDLSMTIAKDEEFNVEAQFEFSKEDKMRYNVYNFLVDVEYETLDGKKGVNSFMIDNQFMNSDIFNVLKYVRNGGNIR
ncbi:MAG: hypothetical protein N2Z71_08555 [Caloramator sp.]|nr:hypothetical protein [Caloramator sp.]